MKLAMHNSEARSRGPLYLVCDQVMYLLRFVATCQIADATLRHSESDCRLSHSRLSSFCVTETVPCYRIWVLFRGFVTRGPAEYPLFSDRKDVTMGSHGRYKDQTLQNS